MDGWIDRYLRRLEFGQFLGRAAEWGASFLFGLGSAVLIVKLVVPNLWPNVLWLAAAFIPVTLAAWSVSRRDRFSRAESVALLDRKLDAGGLLMTLAESADEQWKERLPQDRNVWRESLPRVRPVRFTRFLAPPLLFAVGACFVPLREAKTEPVFRNLMARQASQELEKILELMDDANVLGEEEQQQLREEIEKLTEETTQTPLTHEKWETVDALRDQLRMRLDTTTMTVSKASAAAAALANAENDDARPLSVERTIQLEKDVLDALRKLANNGAFSGLTPGLHSDLERLARSGVSRLPTDPAARRKLLDELNEFLGQESEKLSQCRNECEDGKCPHCGARKQGGT